MGKCNSFVAYSRGNEDYVALGCEHDKVYLHRLDSVRCVGELHEAGAGDVQAIAISEAPTNMRPPDGTDSVDAMWLVVSDYEGVVRIWDVDTRRCISRLHAGKDGLEKNPTFWEIEIARDRGRVVAWDHDNWLLHVWDISPEGEETGHKRMRCDWDYTLSIEFVFAAAGLLGDAARRLEARTDQFLRFR
jgi:WD40 repeat protein